MKLELVIIIIKEELFTVTIVLEELLLGVKSLTTFSISCSIQNWLMLSWNSDLKAEITINPNIIK
jgi:hypothetical protein